MHGLPNAIVFDRDTKFTSNFWKSLLEDLGTELNFSIAYHPHTNGQIERMNRVIEDML
jgi:transposase InsO family protein